MAFIQDIKVSITDGAKAVKQQGFGVPLILGDGDINQGVVGVYSDSQSVSAVYGATSNEYYMASTMFAQEPSPSQVLIYARTEDASNVKETITAALNSAYELNQDFYAIFIPERDIPSLTLAGNWASENKKFFFGCTTDITGLESRVSTNANENEAYLIYDVEKTTVDDVETPIFPECAWAGQNLPKDPGSITWKWKSLNGIGAASSFTLSQLSAIRASNGQTVTEIGGIAVVNEGCTTKGEYIDVIRGRDWIKARIEEQLYNLFLSNEKISMDNVGIAQVESVIRSVLKYAGHKGVIAKATTEDELSKSDDKEYMYKVTVPLREDIPEADRIARNLPDVTFTYYLAGAVHTAAVSGTIKV